MEDKRDIFHASTPAIALWKDIMFFGLSIRLFLNTINFDRLDKLSSNLINDFENFKQMFNSEK